MALRASLLALIFVLATAATATAGVPTNIYTVAGGGSGTQLGIAATSFKLSGPLSVARWGNGAFGLVDASCRVFTVAPAAGSDTGNISLVAGTGSCTPLGYGVYDELANGIPLGNPLAISTGTQYLGNVNRLVIANTSGGRIEQTDSVALDTVAGSTQSCAADTIPDNVAATSATLCQTLDVAGNDAGDKVLLVEGGRAKNEVYEVSAGTIHHLGGVSSWDDAVTRLTYTPDGGFIGTDGYGRIIKAGSGGASPTAISGFFHAALGDGGEVQYATLNSPRAIALTYDGGFVVADAGNCRVRKVSGLLATSIVDTIAGDGCLGGPLGDGGLATGADLDNPTGVAMIPSGLLIADTGHDRVRLVDRTRIVSGPTGTITDNTPTFTFASLDEPAHMKCSLDDGAAFDCPSPFTLPPTADGPHTLKAWENGPPADPTPSTISFTVDATGPTMPDLVSPAADAAGLSPSPTLKWSASSDNISGFDHYELWIDGAKDQDVPACPTATCEATPKAPLSEAAHTWQVKAVDTLGNVTASQIRSLTSGTPPTAVVTINPNPVLVNTVATFSGASSSDTHGPITRYEWDLDGDGTFEVDGGSTPTVTRSFPAPTSVPVKLRVTDGAGKTAEATATLRVSATPEAKSLLGVSINGGAQYTKDPNVTLTVKAPATANAFLVSNDGGFFAPATFPAASTIKWKLDSSGPERLPKTVYLRFVLGPIISDNYTDDIILDEVPPVVQSASLAPQGPGKAASAAALRTFAVKVKAKDSNSGVGKVQVAVNKKKPGKLVAYKTSLKLKLAAKPKFIRAQDRAGNFSAWKQLR